MLIMGLDLEMCVAIILGRHLLAGAACILCIMITKKQYLSASCCIRGDFCVDVKEFSVSPARTHFPAGENVSKVFSSEGEPCI